MEKKEKRFEGTVINGFFMLFLNLALTLGGIALFIWGCVLLDAYNTAGGELMVLGALSVIVSIFLWCGFMMLEPNEARVVTWFGKYAGTFSELTPSTGRRNSRSVPAIWMPNPLR